MTPYFSPSMVAFVSKPPAFHLPPQFHTSNGTFRVKGLMNMRPRAMDDLLIDNNGSTSDDVDLASDVQKRAYEHDLDIFHQVNPLHSLSLPLSCEAERDIDDLPKNHANYAPLTPLGFLERAALIHPKRRSIIYGSIEYTWAQTHSRSLQLASALSRQPIGHGCTVMVIGPNVPAIYEAHFGIPMCGAVINCVNIRSNAEKLAYILEHSEARVVIVDQEFFALTSDSLKLITQNPKSTFKPPLIIVIADPTCESKSLDQALQSGAIEYEKFLEKGDPNFKWVRPTDEWMSIALGYTSGTTSNPKGVVTSHRGAFLASVTGNFSWQLGEAPVYLWTLPMFHCNGWYFPWAIAAHIGTSICQRQVTAKGIFSAIANEGVTHFCVAPIVLNTIIHAPLSDRISPLPRTVHVMTAGAAPQPSVLAAVSRLGFNVTHTYGLTETHGPSTVCAWKPEWNELDSDTQAILRARQGVRYIGMEEVDVVDQKSMKPVPSNGETLGEIVFRGNGVMKGYLKNPSANCEAFAGGWFHSGDLGVKHHNGYIEVKDRLKDIIISGGENISSLEVENVIYMHPDVLEAAVVARKDEEWGESPCAFIFLKEGVEIRNDEDKEILKKKIMSFCKEKLPGYAAIKSIVFVPLPLPKTATGKIKKDELRKQVEELGPVKKS